MDISNILNEPLDYYYKICGVETYLGIFELLIIIKRAGSFHILKDILCALFKYFASNDSFGSARGNLMISL